MFSLCCSHEIFVFRFYVSSCIRTDLWEAWNCISNVLRLPTMQFHLAEFLCEWSCFHYVSKLFGPKYWAKDVCEHEILQNICCVPDQMFQSKKGMTKLTGWSGHITDFLNQGPETSQRLVFGWKWSVEPRGHWEPRSHDLICSDHFEGGISIFE
jgi:hypothetical protein